MAARNWDITPCGAHVLAHAGFFPPESGVGSTLMSELTNRRFALQALLALGGGVCSRSLLAEPNIGTRLPGGGDDPLGALKDPEPLFAAPTRLDRIGRVMTHVMVNGKGPFRFVIDTGASRSTVAPHLARALDLKVSVGRHDMRNIVTGAAEVPNGACHSPKSVEFYVLKLYLPV